MDGFDNFFLIFSFSVCVYNRNTNGQ